MEKELEELQGRGTRHSKERERLNKEMLAEEKKAAKKEAEIDKKVCFYWFLACFQSTEACCRGEAITETALSGLEKGDYLVQDTWILCDAVCGVLFAMLRGLRP